MKKTLLTAALGCLALSPAFADHTASNNGTLAVTVNDYITMVPGSGFNAGPVVFNNPQEMVNGWTVSGTVTIVASRAWKFEYSASNFERNTTGSDPLPTGAAQTVPAGNIWYVGTSNGSTGVATTGGLIPSSTTATNIANQGSGTVGSTFELTGKLVPGLTNQMSGSYSTTIMQLASLN